jgi:hypothetical protein
MILIEFAQIHRGRLTPTTKGSSAPALRSLSSVVVALAAGDPLPASGPELGALDTNCCHHTHLQSQGKHLEHLQFG